MIIEYPNKPTGTTQEQIDQLWEYLWKLAERLNLEERT